MPQAMKKQRLLYGWYEAKDQTFRVSRMPPDSTIRPSISCANQAEVTEVKRRYRAEIFWWPPLPKDRASASA